MAGGKNEDDSAVLFSNFAQEVNLEPATLAKVLRWIVQTMRRRCDESDDNYCKFFMDFDMAVLPDTRRMCARSSSMCPKVRGRVAGAPITGRRLHLMWVS